MTLHFFMIRFVLIYCEMNRIGKGIKNLRCLGIQFLVTNVNYVFLKVIFSTKGRLLGGAGGILFL